MLATLPGLKPLFDWDFPGMPALEASDLQELYERRRRNLDRLIDDVCGTGHGRIKCFVAKVGLPQSLVSRMLSTTMRPENRRSITHDAAREIEAKCGKPSGWLDAQHTEVAGAALQGAASAHAIKLGSLADSSLEQICTELGIATSRTRWMRVPGSADSIVIIDATDITLREGGAYVFLAGASMVYRAVHFRVDGSAELRSASPVDPVEHVARDQLNDLQVVGRCVARITRL